MVLALTNLLAHFTTPWANVAVVPAAAVGLLLAGPLARTGLVRAGTRPRALAVRCRATRWRRSAGRDSVIAIGALLPWTRPMFLNDHYATLSGALIASMIIIPLQTVIPEELAFRGVLHGALDRAWGLRGVAAAGSLLFGLWHIATSMGLTASNVGFTRILGGGVFGMVAGVVGRRARHRRRRVSCSPGYVAAAAA